MKPKVTRAAAILAASLLTLVCLAGCPTPGSGPEPTKYSVTYIVNEVEATGAVPVDASTYAQGANVILAGPGDLVLNGHAFDGWRLSAAGEGALHAAGSSITMGSEDLVLYAQWTVNAYAVSFDSRRGSVVQGQNADYGQTISKPADPSLIGYAFEAWYTSTSFDDAWDFAVDTVPAEAITLYAKWTAVQYSIRYELDGGTNASANPTSYTIESQAISLASPAKTGYSFAGWYADSSFQNALSSIAVGSTGDKAVYAKWTAVDYSITYSLNGGTNASANPAGYTIESPDIDLAAPTKDGYSFAGWYADSGFQSSLSSIAAGSTGSKAFYAKWLPKPGIDVTLPSLTIDGVPADRELSRSETWTLSASLQGASALADYSWFDASEAVYGSEATISLRGSSFANLGRTTLYVSVTDGGKTWQEAIVFTVVRD